MRRQQIISTGAADLGKKRVFVSPQELPLLWRCCDGSQGIVMFASHLLIHRFVSFRFFSLLLRRHDTIRGSLRLSVTRQPYDCASVSSDHQSFRGSCDMTFDLSVRLMLSTGSTRDPVCPRSRTSKAATYMLFPSFLSFFHHVPDLLEPSRAPCFLFSLSCFMSR